MTRGDIPENLSDHDLCDCIEKLQESAADAYKQVGAVELEEWVQMGERYASEARRRGLA